MKSKRSKILREAFLYLLRHPKAAIFAMYCAQNNLLNRIEVNPLRCVDLKEVIGADFPTVRPISFLYGGSTATDYALLKGLGKTFDKNTSDYLEIGTWRGESIMNMVDVVNKCVSVTLNPESDNMEQFADTYNIFIDPSKGIHQIYADSHMFDFKSLNKKFDIIFIDGDHSYEGIYNDTKKAMELLKNDDSVIVWHDYAIHNEIPVPNTLYAIYDAMPKCEHKYLYHVENTMCAIYSKKPMVNVREHENCPKVPRHYFEVDIRQFDI